MKILYISPLRFAGSLNSYSSGAIRVPWILGLGSSRKGTAKIMFSSQLLAHTKKLSLWA